MGSNANESDPLLSASPTVQNSSAPSPPTSSLSNSRRPYHPAGEPHGEADFRYKYYNRVDPSMRIPDHVVSRAFLVLAFPALSLRPGEFLHPRTAASQDCKQGSIVTIFSVWNTMMGTSLLALPWAFAQSGLALGIILTIFVGALAFYTCTLIIRSARYSEVYTSIRDSLGEQVVDFPFICRIYLGRYAEYTSILFSVLSLVSAAIVYWVIMSSFLYDAGHFLIHHSVANSTHNSSVPHHNSSYTDAAYFRNSSLYAMIFRISLPAVEENPYWAPQFVGLRADTDAVSSPPLAAVPDTNGTSLVWLEKYWTEHFSVPLYLLLILVPLCSIRVPTFLTRLNAFGVISVVYLLAFVIYYASRWGMHLQPSSPTDTSIRQFDLHFPSLTGILSLGFFIHNCILSLLAPHAKPQHAERDVGIAFSLVALTYLIVGASFYACFPLPKTEILDNFLRNFSSSDPLSFLARIFLLIQLLTVFPLILFILRLQIIIPMFGRAASMKHGWIILVNSSVMLLGVLFAMFYPKVGVLISITGSLSGLMCLYALPSLVHMAALRRAGRASGNLKWLVHFSIVFLGCANLISQFATHFG